MRTLARHSCCLPRTRAYGAHFPESLSPFFVVSSCLVPPSIASSLHHSSLFPIPCSLFERHHAIEHRVASGLAAARHKLQLVTHMTRHRVAPSKCTYKSSLHDAYPHCGHSLATHNPLSLRYTVARCMLHPSPFLPSILYHGQLRPHLPINFMIAFPVFFTSGLLPSILSELHSPSISRHPTLLPP